MRRGYVLANVRFNTPEHAQAYGQQVPATIAQYGAIRSVRWANAESQLMFFEGVDDAAHEPANTIEDS